MKGNAIIDCLLVKLAEAGERSMACQVSHHRAQQHRPPLPADPVKGAHGVDEVEEIVIVQHIALERHRKQGIENPPRRHGLASQGQRPFGKALFMSPDRS